MFTYFQEKLKIFQSYALCRRRKDGITNKNMPQPCNESPPAAREKGDPQAGQRGCLFAAGISVAAYFSCAARLGPAV